MTPGARLARAIVAALVLAGSACATTTSKQDTPSESRVARKKKAPRPAAAVEPAPVEPAPDAVASTEPATPPLAMSSEPAAPAEVGLASYYADSLAGNRTANGERYRPGDKTCAHRTHKFGTRLVVTADDTGRSATCRVNDRGPFVQGRVVDVSRRVADELGMIQRGVIKVRVEVAADGSGS